MSKLYKYELTLVTGETKEFESKYSPKELKISLSGFHHSYSLKAYGNILYGNVINYKLIEAVEETTTAKTATDNLESSEVKLRVFMSFFMSFFMIFIPVTYYLFKAETGHSVSGTHENILCGILIFGIILFLAGIFYDRITSKDINKE